MDDGATVVVVPIPNDGVGGYHRLERPLRKREITELCPRTGMPRPYGRTARSLRWLAYAGGLATTRVPFFWPTWVDILRADWNPSRETLKPLVAGRRVDGAGFRRVQARRTTSAITVSSER